MDLEDRLSILRSKLFGKRDLWRAAKIGDVKAIERLISHGADPNKRKTTLNLEGTTPLHLAVEYEQIQAVKALIRLGAKVNAKDHHGTTALMLAARAENSEQLITLLINAGADINDQDKTGMSALDCAASYGRVDAIKLLLDHGANPNVARGDRISAPLIWAVMDEHAGPKHLEAVKLLLARGANVDTSRSGGDPALHTAALYGHTEIVKVLLDAGANPNSRNNNNQTALISAATTKQLEVIKVLLQRGANVNAVNNMGESALDRAYDELIVPRLIKILFNPGPDRKFNPDVIRILTESGAKRGAELMKE